MIRGVVDGKGHKTDKVCDEVLDRDWRTDNMGSILSTVSGVV